jgi:hypothetical protein
VFFWNPCGRELVAFGNLGWKKSYYGSEVEALIDNLWSYRCFGDSVVADL